MALPDRTTLRSYAGSATPTYLTSNIGNTYSPGQTFTIASTIDWNEVTISGTKSNNALGTSGVFTLVVDYGLPTEEKILCSGVITLGSNTVVTVYYDGASNGRGYDGTPVVAHGTGSSSNYNVFPVATAVEQLQFNQTVAGAVVSGTAAGGDLSGNYPNPSLVTINTVTSGIYGNVATVPVVTVDGKGRVISISGNTISIAQTQVSGLTNTLNTISGELTVLSGNISTISGEVTVLSGNISVISGEVTLLSGSISTISGTLSTTVNNVAILSGSVTLLSGQVSALTVQVSGLSVQVASLSGSVANALVSGTPATGDLRGYFPNPTVNQLQGVPVTGVPTVSGQVLGYTGTTWAPTAILGGSSNLVSVTQNNLSNAISSTLLYQAPATGVYQVGYYINVVSGATTSSVLGPLTLVSTDPSGNTTTTYGPSTSTNNPATGVLNGTLSVYVLSGTNINYALGYTSVGATSMHYNMQLILNALSISTNVTSFNGRTGPVSPTSNDYLAAAVGGIAGATAPTRYVGGTTGGAPITGTFAKGDFVVDQTGSIYICTNAGTPGTWTLPGTAAQTSAGTSFTTIFASGTNQGTATPITTGGAQVQGANGTNGVLLPLPTAGNVVYIDNADPNNTLLVYPYGTGTIDGATAGQPIVLTPSSYWMGVCEAGGLSASWASWIGAYTGTANQVNVTYGNGQINWGLASTINVNTTGNAATANGGTYANVNASGTTQATATPIVATVNTVNGANNTNGVRLPSGTAGQIIYIDNNSGNNLNLYATASGIVDGTTPGQPAVLVPSAYWIGICEAGGTNNVWASFVGALLGTNNQMSVTYGNGQTVWALASTVVTSGFQAQGFPGAQFASRYAGATQFNSPTTGTWNLGDYVIDQTGNIWICTQAGTPGQWREVSQDVITNTIMGAYL